MIIPLQKAYESRYGQPVLDRVDTAIFDHSYVADCMGCDHCMDSCCAYGIDLSAMEADRLYARADELERYTGIPRTQWITGEFKVDAEFPGGGFTRTRTTERGCIFLHPTSRGCQIHGFCLDKGLDYHDLKPMVSLLFPLTFDQGLLHPSAEIKDSSLTCLGSGRTLYQGARDELLYYFGEELAVELDALAARTVSAL